MGVFLAGAGAARLGEEMAGPALLLAGFALTGSAASASFVLAGITVSAVLGGPLVGALLDRSATPGRVLCGALALHGAGLAATLGLLGRAPVAVTVGVAAVAGLCGPALSAGWSSQLPGVTRPETLHRAHTWDAMTFDLAGLTGPALTAAAGALLGAPAAVMTAVALVGLALAPAWSLPRRGPAGGERPPVRAALAGTVEAGKAMMRARPLARATLITVLTCGAQGMLVACSPHLGRRAFGGPEHGVLLLSGAAGAALAANAVLARRRRAPVPDLVIGRSALLQAAALLLAADGRPLPVVVAVVVMGVADGPQLAALFAVRHREAPDRLRAQVFTLGAGLKVTAFALGAALAGILTARSLTGALLAAAGLALLAGLVHVRARRPCVRPRRP